jgi:hypothetical protein
MTRMPLNGMTTSSAETKSLRSISRRTRWDDSGPRPGVSRRSWMVLGWGVVDGGWWMGGGGWGVVDGGWRMVDT